MERKILPLLLPGFELETFQSHPSLIVSLLSFMHSASSQSIVSDNKGATHISPIASPQCITGSWNFFCLFRLPPCVLICDRVKSLSWCHSRHAPCKCWTAVNLPLRVQLFRKVSWWPDFQQRTCELVFSIISDFVDLKKKNFFEVPFFISILIGALDLSWKTVLKINTHNLGSIASLREG